MKYNDQASGNFEEGGPTSLAPYVQQSQQDSEFKDTMGEISERVSEFEEQSLNDDSESLRKVQNNWNLVKCRVELQGQKTLVVKGISINIVYGKDILEVNSETIVNQINNYLDLYHGGNDG